ncbi:MAG TPA: hypothetical protein VNM15_00095 [Candidatus Binatia bacterium]|nr:hypothetical protein [Candidatus Binatia bacterium]
MSVPIDLDPTRGSEVVITLSAERKYWVVEADAVLSPVFAVVLLNEKVLPAFLLAGGFPMLLTVRSGWLGCPAWAVEIINKWQASTKLKPSKVASDSFFTAEHFTEEGNIETPLCRSRRAKRTEGF